MSNINIIIRNDFFRNKDDSHSSIIKVIGRRGFAVFSYLLSLTRNGVVVTSANQIMSYLRISKTREISCILCNLHSLGLYNTMDKLDIIKKNTIIELDFSNYLCTSIASGGYTLIPWYIFEHHFKVISFNGWAVYSILYHLHNPLFTGIFSGGYANPSEEYLGKVLGLHRQTVSKVTAVLAEQGLIQIVRPRVTNRGVVSQDKSCHTKFPVKLYVVIDKKYKILNMRRKNQ